MKDGGQCPRMAVISSRRAAPPCFSLCGENTGFMTYHLQFWSPHSTLPALDAFLKKVFNLFFILSWDTLPKHPNVICNLLLPDCAETNLNSIFVCSCSLHNNICCTVYNQCIMTSYVFDKFLNETFFLFRS